MANSSARDGDVARLHPAIRDKVVAIRKALRDEGIPFEVFEAFRTPERQAQLYAKGRSTKGPKVTWVDAWGSIHQYGLAVDFVLKPGGRWSWDDQGAEAGHWTRMHELAKAHGMTPLYNSRGQLIEKPHIQLEGVSASELRAGRFPEGGDAIWAEHLGELIDGWRGGGAPPRPALAPVPPGLPDEVIAELEPAPKASARDARFARFQVFIRQAEGGFANHPRDDGGATNLGITIGTLSEWRGRECTVEELRALSQDEADEIYFTRYYAATRCAELPDRVAAVVYNGAVLCGPKRSVEFLQTGFNDIGLGVDGAPLAVDGKLGRLTMAAARQTDPTALAEAYLDRQVEHHQAHADFDVFGAGWLNRVARLRAFIATLPEGSGRKPAPARTRVTDRIGDRIEDLGEKVGGAREALSDRAASVSDRTEAALARAVGALLDIRDGDSDDRAQRKRIARRVVSALTEEGEDGTAPLTPVNAALGQTIGRLLNGKKSVIGITGLLLVSFGPDILRPDGATGVVRDWLEANDQQLLTSLSIFTGWGFLGKIDKIVRDVRG